MTLRVDVRPRLLEWARTRSGIDDETWTKRFPAYDTWLAGDRRPTFRQLEDFAAKTHTPLGYLLLDEPPEEELPIADFRVIAGTDQARPGADLLDTIYACQQRQEWYRDDALLHGEEHLRFVGSLATSTPVEAAAAQLRNQLAWDAQAGQAAGSWSGAVTSLRNRMEGAGVLVMITGHVGSNTHRTLDPDEFRGFALVDDFAPLVFVNGADAKAAQVFTLVHELAHIWLGQGGLDDVDPQAQPADAAASTRSSSAAVERWCNAVAAEVLVPLAEIDGYKQPLGNHEEILERVRDVARRYRVSQPVALTRLREAGGLSWADDGELRRRLYAEYWAARSERGGGGGDFYPSLLAASSRRFTEALVASTLEGRTQYRDAFRMLGIKSQKAFDGLIDRLRVG